MNKNLTNVTLNRDLVSEYFQRFMPLISVPGPVEIDECHLGSRVRGRHGRIPNPGQVVFGIKCRTTKILLLFPIPDKSQETIFPLILGHIDAGAEIYSDKFSTYISRRGNSHLENLGYEHYFINHSLEFVDPIQNSIHTNNIERSWRSLRASISHVKRGLPRQKLQPFLDTFQFLQYFSKEALYDVLLQIVVALQ